MQVARLLPAEFLLDLDLEGTKLVERADPMNPILKV